MRLLLDTHVVLWALTDSPKLDDAARDQLAAADTRYVSAASAYEVAFKLRLGKLSGAGPIRDAWPSVVRRLQAEELSLSSRHMVNAGVLDWDHRDPFDRMLVAQAQADGLVLMTADRRIRAFGDVRTRWGHDRT